MNIKEQWREIILIVFMIAISIFLFMKNVDSVSENIIITEICPSGCATSGYQWIEIYNKSTDPVDLIGWKFWEESTNHSITLSPSSTVTSTILLPQSYAVIAQNDVLFFADHPEVTSTVFDSSWTTLTKTGEEIGIKKGSGVDDFIEQFVYTGINNFSLERIGSDGDPASSLQWKEHLNGSTPGMQNYWWEDNLGVVNHIPIAHIEALGEAETNEGVVFDASQSSDFEGSVTNYQWMIENTLYEGVNVTYAFTTVGIKEVVLTVFDTDGASSTVSHIIEIIAPDEQVQEFVSTSTSKIFINEFLSDPNTGEKEWVELFNASENEISFEGYTLYDGVGKIATVTGTIASSGFHTIYLSSSRLNQSGDFIRLKNSVGDIVDTVAYGNWNDGDVSDNALVPGKGHAIARISDGEDIENNSVDFAYTITPTPNDSNNITPKEVSSFAPSSGGSSQSIIINQSVLPSFFEGSILINELVSIPADNENEFVELYNTMNFSISLEGWSVQDGSLAKTMLSGLLLPHEFYVIEKPKGSLNNSGDLLTLTDPSGKEIDRVVYGSWNGEDVTALIPPKGASLIRVNYVDTGEYVKDFLVTETITKGRVNILAHTTEEDKSRLTPMVVVTSTLSTMGIRVVSGTIFISEIFPNPTGVDDKKEFIEIYNSGSLTVNLSNWKLGDTVKKYSIEDVFIQPQTFYAFYRKETGISLNNFGEETISLWDATGALFDSVVYSGTVQNDSSYSKFGNEWMWVATSTPGEENIVAVEDEEEGVLRPAPTGDLQTILYSEDFLPRIVEILPNPVGTDGNSEYIELYNPYDREISLLGLLLDDDKGGSKPFVFPENALIPARSYRTWYSKDTKISLNNSSDVVRILDPDQSVLEEVEYIGAKEGKSYTLGNNIWFWTSELTPGIKNPISPSVTPVKKKASVVPSKPVVATTLEQSRNYEMGTVVKLTGIVSTEPGLLSSQYMYIGGENGTGVQVYSSKKDFPSVVRGDKVEIAGELSEASGEVRIKTRTARDIHVVSTSAQIVPLQSEVAEVGEVYEGGLIEVVGEVTGIKGSYIYLDDGTDEIRVYIRSGSGIDTSIFKEGMKVAITGIVQETKSGYLISPRDMKDIRLEKGDVKGEKISGVSNALDTSSNKQILYALLLVFVGVATVLGIKLYGGKIKDYLKTKIKN